MLLLLAFVKNSSYNPATLKCVSNNLKHLPERRNQLYCLQMVL